MFGIGSSELILILLIVLLLFGPSRLPELAKGIGKMIHELRRGAAGIQDEVQREPKAADDRKS